MYVYTKHCFDGQKNHALLCSNHSVRETHRNLINLIFASWKVITYSKKEQTEDVYVMNIVDYINLCFPEQLKGNKLGLSVKAGMGNQETEWGECKVWGWKCGESGSDCRDGGGNARNTRNVRNLLGMRGIGVRMWGIRMGMRELRVRIRGIWVGMRRIELK